MRLSEPLKREFLTAAKEAFGESDLVLFGSRVDENTRGGDFDLAVMKEMSKEEFRRAKVRFFRHLLLKDLDLPVDLVLYCHASDLLKSEIESKGVRLSPSS